MRGNSEQSRERKSCQDLIKVLRAEKCAKPNRQYWSGERRDGWMGRVKYSENTDRGNLPPSSVVCVRPADVCVLEEQFYTIHLILQRCVAGVERFLAPH